MICSYSCETKQNTSSFEPYWLKGHWVQSEEEYITHEIWHKKSSIYIGHGFIMQNKDTVWQENMKIHQFNKQWILSIKTPENSEQVDFVIEKWTDSTFMAKNAIHDFPKQISYSTNGNKLIAVVSGEEKVLNYQFSKVD